MDVSEIKKAFSMPLASPSFPKGPYRFMNREYFIVRYLSDALAIRHALPEPLEPDGSNVVLYEFIKMPDSSGFGDYEESGIVIPCLFKGEPVNFTAQMYLDCQPPIAGGREIWGFPKKDAKPKLCTESDTLTGRLIYGNTLVALGTMGFKHVNMLQRDEDRQAMIKGMQKTQVNIKIIPHVSGQKYDVLQLVAYNLEDIQLDFYYTGPARLALTPHVNAPVADFPVKEVLGGMHYKANLTLPMGRVLHDYLG